MAYKIFGLMLGIFRPSTALEAAVRLEASVKNYLFTGQCFEQLSVPPLTESRGAVFYLTSIKTQALKASPAPHTLPPQRFRQQIGREENQNG